MASGGASGGGGTINHLNPPTNPILFITQRRRRHWYLPLATAASPPPSSARRGRPVGGHRDRAPGLRSCARGCRTHAACPRPRRCRTIVGGADLQWRRGLLLVLRPHADNAAATGGMHGRCVARGMTRPRPRQRREWRGLAGA